MSLVKCQKCGSLISDKARFCPCCGESYSGESLATDMLCKECGKIILQGEKVCSRCGCPAFEFIKQNTGSEEASAFVAFHTSTQSTEKNTRKKRRWPIYISIALGVLLTVWLLSVVVSHTTTCSAGNCDRKKLSGSSYCYIHTCQAAGCHNYKTENETYCFSHRWDNQEFPSIVLQIHNVRVYSNGSYTICEGTVTNKGKKTYRFVEVKGSFMDVNETVLDTDWTYAAGSEGLAPGESTTFRMSVSQNHKIVACKVTLLDYSAN